MTFVWIFIVGFISWLISTLSAGGGGLILVPLVTLILGARAVPPVLGVGELIGQPSRVVFMWEHIRWDVVKWYLPGGITGSILGAWLFTRTETGWFQILVGLYLISTIFQYQFGKKERTFPMKAWYFLPVGFLVTFIGSLLGTMGPILNPFYLNYGTLKEEMISTKSFNSTVAHILQVGTYALLGAMTGELWLYGITIGIAAILATWVGKNILANMKNEQFRFVVVAMMVISGIAMIWEQRELVIRAMGG